MFLLLMLLLAMALLPEDSIQFLEGYRWGKRPRVLFAPAMGKHSGMKAEGFTTLLISKDSGEK